MCELVLETLGRGGNVLLPSDAAGRSLELLLLLEGLWRERRLGEGPQPFRLVFVHAMAWNVIEYAKSQVSVSPNQHLNGNRS